MVFNVNDFNPRDLDDDVLLQLASMVEHEQDRRKTLATATDTMDKLNRDYLKASGIEPGDEWRKPLSTVDSYPKGWTVTYQDKTWKSTLAFNTWEPPTNWREQVPEGAPPAEWVKPSSTEDAYELGDRVTFEGHVYESIWENPNTWSPTEFPDAWKLVE